MSDSKPTWLYVMQSGEFYKVGISNNVDSRRKQVNTASPLGVEVVRKYGPNARSVAVEAEKRMHTKLRDTHVHGEWFNAPLREIDHTFKKVLAELKLEWFDTQRDGKSLDFRPEPSYGIRYSDARAREALYDLLSGPDDHPLGYWRPTDISVSLALASHPDGMRLTDLASYLDISALRLLDDLETEADNGFIVFDFDSATLRLGRIHTLNPSWWAGDGVHDLFDLEDQGPAKQAWDDLGELVNDHEADIRHLHERNLRDALSEGCTSISAPLRSVT